MGNKATIYKDSKSPLHIKYYQLGENMISPIHLYFSLPIFIVYLILPSIVTKAELNISTDTSSLISLRSHITSSNFLLRNWTTRSSVCNWYGVICNLRHHRVVELNISYMGLQGSIPPTIGNLSFLRILDLRGNNFQENLPSELAHLRRLETLSLRVNNFSGGIPLWIGSLPRLQILSLGNNSFTGVIPDSLCNISTLEIFDARFNQLDGNIPANIGYCQNLRLLSLYTNKLTGAIPTSFFNMSSLEYLDISSNGLIGDLSGEYFRNFPRLKQLSLSNNEFSGEVLLGMHECSQLEMLSLSYNMFTGPIPHEIGNLTRLRMLYLGVNNWISEIPREIGNMSSLELLELSNSDLSNATITGVIPPEIGKLVHLRNLGLQLNYLCGPIPMSLLNISSLEVMALAFNNFSSNFPCEYYNLPNLKILYLASSGLRGNILECISNSSNLEIINLPVNQFTGSIPTSLGNLKFLENLNLEKNNFVADPSLSFMSSLANCRNLHTLIVSNNDLNTSLPSSIGNLTSLLFFSAYDCGLYGRIPQEIGNLTNMISLILASNHFIGSIPTTIKSMKSLNQIFLADNEIEGSLPFELCELNDLYYLEADRNQLTGAIPQCLSNATSLQIIHLSSNMLSSNIWESLCTVRIVEFNLSNNNLSGNIPQRIGNLEEAVVIDLSMNQLSGTLPTTLSNLQSLANFSLSHNQLEGSIPESLSDMLGLEYLDLSNNNLVGTIPKSLEGLKYLQYFNVSSNRLTGEVPTNGHFSNFTYKSFMSNEGLCGSPLLQLPPCTSSKKSSRRKVPLAVIIVLPVIATFLILATAFVLIKFRETKKRNQEENLPSLVGYKRLPYHELDVATNGFSESNLVATGGFGSVYEGKLFDGTIVAIKVFNLQSEGAFRSFDIECQVLGNLRHRNLTKVISSCSNLDFRALVMEYMPNGSLEKWLYSYNNFLNILQRLDIMIDVAAAMEYLHHGYSTPIIHCDLKPSNILLDENMTGHVCDFGLSKLFGLGEFLAQTKTFATIGYISPEYGYKGLVSTSSDVYSYGVLLMEVFSRKRPIDDMFEGELNLKSWIAEYAHKEITHVVDENLIADDTKKLQGKLRCLKCVMELALKCSEELPEERINMIDAHMLLKKIRIELNEVVG